MREKKLSFEEGLGQADYGKYPDAEVRTPRGVFTRKLHKLCAQLDTKGPQTREENGMCQGVDVPGTEPFAQGADGAFVPESQLAPPAASGAPAPVPSGAPAPAGSAPAPAAS